MSTKKIVFVPPKKTPSTPAEKHMRSIFSSMANLSRLQIIRVLYSKGPSTYTGIRDEAGFETKRNGGKFSYHLHRLSDLGLIERNTTERRYDITNKGKLVLELVDRIEAHSFVESGKLRVRLSNSSIDEFNKQRILQSLVKESDMPYELADKMAKKIENNIHKYDLSYITGSLIRDVVNFFLLANNHEEYRSRYVRFGMPVHDIKQMFDNLNNVDGGMDDLLLAAGKNVFAENTMFSTLPKDLVDKHMEGFIHLSNLATWTFLPDVLFVNIKEILDNGMDIGGKHTTTSRVTKTTQIYDVMSSLSLMIQLLLKETSNELVLAGLPQLLAKRCGDKSDLEIELGLLFAFMTSSVVVGSVTNTPTSTLAGRLSREFDTKLTSIRLNLSSDPKTTNCIINAYARYVKQTPKPSIGLVINCEKEAIASISSRVAEIVLLGGRVLFTKQPQVSSRGVVGGSLNKADSIMSMALQSVSINLPSLAYQVDKGDTEYFVARLILVINDVINALLQRKKAIFDATRSGLNPMIAKHTKCMQHAYASLTINLVGFQDTIFDILGFTYNRKGNESIKNILSQAVSVGNSTSKDRPEPVTICIADSDGAERFANLDNKRYGKHSTGHVDTKPYKQGLKFNASEISNYVAKNPQITMCNKINRALSAGLQIELNIPEDENDSASIKDAIEKMYILVPSFMPIKDIFICPECGYKEKYFDIKCPKCHAPRHTS